MKTQNSLAAYLTSRNHEKIFYSTTKMILDSRFSYLSRKRIYLHMKTGLYQIFYKKLFQFNPKSTGGRGVPPVRFLLLTSEVESFSTGNFVTFPDIKCRIRKKIKFFRNLLLGSRDMAIFRERAS